MRLGGPHTPNTLRAQQRDPGWQAEQEAPDASETEIGNWGCFSYLSLHPIFFFLNCHSARHLLKAFSGGLVRLQGQNNANDSSPEQRAEALHRAHSPLLFIPSAPRSLDIPTTTPSARRGCLAAASAGATSLILGSQTHSCPPTSNPKAAPAPQPQDPLASPMTENKQPREVAGEGGFLRSSCSHQDTAA